MVFLLCLVLLVAAPLVHIILCSMNISGRVKISIILITLLSIIGGIALPILASYIDIMNLPPSVKCGTPSLGFMYLGILLTVTTIPVSAIIFSIIAYYRRKKLNVTG